MVDNDDFPPEEVWVADAPELPGMLRVLEKIEATGFGPYRGYRLKLQEPDGTVREVTHPILPRVPRIDPGSGLDLVAVYLSDTFAESLVPLHEEAVFDMLSGLRYAMQVLTRDQVDAGPAADAIEVVQCLYGVPDLRRQIGQTNSGEALVQADDLAMVAFRAGVMVGRLLAREVEHDAILGGKVRRAGGRRQVYRNAVRTEFQKQRKRDPKATRSEIRKRTAKAVGCSPRTVERHCADLWPSRRYEQRKPRIS